MPLENIKL